MKSSAIILREAHPDPCFHSWLLWKRLNLQRQSLPLEEGSIYDPCMEASRTKKGALVTLPCNLSYRPYMLHAHLPLQIGVACFIQLCSSMWPWLQATERENAGKDQLKTLRICISTPPSGTSLSTSIRKENSKCLHCLILVNLNLFECHFVDWLYDLLVNFLNLDTYHQYVQYLSTRRSSATSFITASPSNSLSTTHGTTP